MAGLGILKRRLSAFNPKALAALAVIFAGLFVQGANTPASTSLFSGILLALAIVATLASSSRAVAAVAEFNAPSILAAILFIALASAQFAGSAWPIEGAQAVALRSLSPTSTLEGIVSFVGVCAAFYLGALATVKRSRTSVSFWLSVFTILYTAYALALFFGLYSGQASERLDAGIGTPNAAAVVFGLLALLAMARVFIGEPKPDTNKIDLLALLKTPLAASAFAFSLCAALLTASRGGLAALAIGFGVFAVLLTLRLRGAARVLVIGPAAALAAAGVWVISIGAEPVLNRMADAPDALVSRQELLAPHWQAFLARPLFGHGLNTFHELNAMLQTPANLNDLRPVGAAHNIFVQSLEETGVVGAALLFLAMAFPLFRALAGAFEAETSRFWAAAMYAVGFMFLLHGMMDFALQIPAAAALFAFCLGAFTPTQTPK